MMTLFEFLEASASRRALVAAHGYARPGLPWEERWHGQTVWCVQTDYDKWTGLEDGDVLQDGVLVATSAGVCSMRTLKFTDATGEAFVIAPASGVA